MTEYKEGIYKQELGRERRDLSWPSRPSRRPRAGWSGPAGPSAVEQRPGRKGGARPPPRSWPTSISMTASTPPSKAPSARRIALERPSRQARRCCRKIHQAPRPSRSCGRGRKGQSDELAKQATWELEKSKEAKLERQIAACRLYSPESTAWWSIATADRGRQPRPRAQKILSIPDLSRMQVNAKVHESQVDKISSRTEGQDPRRRFRRPAPQRHCGGRGPAARSEDLPQFDIKVYINQVRIDDPLPGLRPGMTAEVEILVNEPEHVLSVPVETALVYQGTE